MVSHLLYAYCIPITTISIPQSSRDSALYLTLRQILAYFFSTLQSPTCGLLPQRVDCFYFDLNNLLADVARCLLKHPLTFIPLDNDRLQMYSHSLFS